MVDVTHKSPTARRALARAVVRMRPETLRHLSADENTKGSVLAVARIAAIQATKRTGDLIPLCHPLGLSKVTVEFERLGRGDLEIRVEAATFERTGVEMEAMTGASIGALTIYDMLKAIEKGIQIVRVELLEKDGGKSGPWRRRRRASGAGA